MRKRIISFLVIVFLFANGLIGCSKQPITVDNAGDIHTHSYQSEKIEPTCVKEGYTRYECNCGDYYITNYVEKKEHVYVEKVITSATCTQKGTKRYECNCGDYYTNSYELGEKNASEVYAEVNKSVGEIITFDNYGEELALGTCFVYAADGKIITNYHVIKDAYSAKVYINEKTYQVKKILAYDKDKDLVVLKIDANNLKAVNICKKEHQVGKTIFAIGSSRGLTSTFSQGIVTFANREIDGVKYVQHDAAISSGNSGGPLVNSYCEVIGINTMTIKDSQNLNFAISVNEIDNLNFSTPLTFAEFYEKEFDVFNKLKNFIIANGEYNANDNDYTVSFGSYYWTSNYNYMSGAYYDVTNNTITLTNYIYNKTMTYSIMTFVDIESINGVYEWSIIDAEANFMSGNIYASSFTSNTVLTYSYKSGFSGSEYSAREVASQMIYQTLKDMSIDYYSIGISASDLGFIYID